MVNELELLRGHSYKINDEITIKHPTIGQIYEYGEEAYWELVNTLCSTPSDYMVELHDMGIDYEQISDFNFFYSIAHNLPQNKTEILLGNIDLQKLEEATLSTTGEIVYFYLLEDGSPFVIDEVTYCLIVECICKMHSVEKKKTIGGNEHTKQYLIDREKRRRKRRHKTNFESRLLPYISALVNSEGFKYDYESIWSLPIFVFFDSFKRIEKIREYTYLMIGTYSGSIDRKGLDYSKYHWAN